MKKLLRMSVLALLISGAVPGQEVDISSIKILDRSAEIGIVVKNTSSKDFFVVGSSAISAELNYFLEANEKTKTLTVNRNMFLYPHAAITDLVEPCYKLERLKAGEVYRETLALGYPRAVNIFPIDHYVDVDKYDFLRIQFGLLPADEFITKFQESRAIGNCVMPGDLMSDGTYKGKTLVELQAIYSSKPYSIRK